MIYRYVNGPKRGAFEREIARALTCSPPLFRYCQFCGAIPRSFHLPSFLSKIFEEENGTARNLFSHVLYALYALLKVRCRTCFLILVTLLPMRLKIPMGRRGRNPVGPALTMMRWRQSRVAGPGLLLMMLAAREVGEAGEAGEAGGRRPQRSLGSPKPGSPNPVVRGRRGSLPMKRLTTKAKKAVLRW